MNTCQGMSQRPRFHPVLPLASRQLLTPPPTLQTHPYKKQSPVVTAGVIIIPPVIGIDIVSTVATDIATAFVTVVANAVNNAIASALATSIFTDIDNDIDIAELKLLWILPLLSALLLHLTLLLSSLSPEFDSRLAHQVCV